MLKVGLTGNIGSGKTYIAKIFEKLSVPVYYSDINAQTLMQTNIELITKIKEIAGEEAYLSDGSLNKKYLANFIFGNIDNLKKINSIVHPFVMADFSIFCAKHSREKYVIMESAILFETGLYKEFDKIILVWANKKTRIQRIIQRDTLSKEEILQKIKNQIVSSKFKKKADFIINNEGQGNMLLSKILKIHNSLCMIN